MLKKQARMVRDKIDWEGGLLVCLSDCTDFPEVRDKKFRSLVKALLDASDELTAYLESEYERHGLNEY